MVTIKYIVSKSYTSWPMILAALSVPLVVVVMPDRIRRADSEAAVTSRHLVRT